MHKHRKICKRHLALRQVIYVLIPFSYIFEHISVSNMKLDGIFFPKNNMVKCVCVDFLKKTLKITYTCKLHIRDKFRNINILLFKPEIRRLLQVVSHANTYNIDILIMHL